jgi:hypothetical protein
MIVSLSSAQCVELPSVLFLKQLQMQQNYFLEGNPGNETKVQLSTLFRVVLVKLHEHRHSQLQKETLLSYDSQRILFLFGQRFYIF